MQEFIDRGAVFFYEEFCVLKEGVGCKCRKCFHNRGFKRGMIKELYHLLKSCFLPRYKEIVFVLFVFDYACNPVFMKSKTRILHSFKRRVIGGRNGKYVSLCMLVMLGKYIYR